ncbi:conserved hypothetical protein [Talaromyces stipitatus ATCC 10500]|uniref:Crinkler effector protein N-terminal domain-containing protein n=1 Tax=Talaromyces stipitatus (strain ATCC 10500 / CBS 375.48 / QM 6759 / NRRL 1006) TaxID=441959 RepID=B8LYU9_TALSN|nr:uncharacterized protein TSTA_068820 [Talaromyces stipitatus ATCC 10500]EED23457.1 conserved hypothetical protein [Talaromyces stipitatus ATCC 10500]
MAEPSQRRLWCAFSDNIDNMFPIDCNINVDSIADVKKKIWSESQPKLAQVASWELDLYSPSSPVKNIPTRENLVHLHPRKRILSDFPRSNDPDIDIIVIQPEEQQHSIATQVSNSPRLEPCRMICTRDETVSRLAEVIDSQNIVHVRGTPASGKSTLSLLLRDYYRRNGRTVFWLGIWEQNLREFGDEDPWANLARYIRCNYPRLDKKQNIFANGNVIIIDEAQTSYGDTALWNQIIKDIRGGIGYKVKLCLFCSYGSPSEGLPYNRRDHGTPVGFGRAQRISLTPSGELGSPPIGLFYNRDEFEIVVTKLCSSDPVEKYSVDNDARDYIFNLTNGHPGAVSSIVYYLFQVYRSQVKYKDISTITQDHVTQALADDNKVFGGLDGSIVFRSFPFPGKLTPEARSALITILEDGYILFDESSDGIRCCYENGWIHRAILGDSSLQQNSVGVLPSRLHEKYVEFLIGETQLHFPEAFPTIQSLCMEILKRFSAKKLRHSVEGKLSTASRLRPLEAQYQDEFYRAFNSVVGRGVPISSEWSREGDGRVDFWIPQKRWGIELLREHSNVDEHCNRFKKGGRYYPWIEAGMLKDWILIDCATSLPSSEHTEPKLWRAVFENDYSQLMMLDYRNNCLMGPTVLVN